MKFSFAVREIEESQWCRISNPEESLGKGKSYFMKYEWLL
jgi:hypothetical protein